MERRVRTSEEMTSPTCHDRNDLRLDEAFDDCFAREAVREYVHLVTPPFALAGNVTLARVGPGITVDLLYVLDSDVLLRDYLNEYMVLGVRVCIRKVFVAWFLMSLLSPWYSYGRDRIALSNAVLYALYFLHLTPVDLKR